MAANDGVLKVVLPDERTTGLGELDFVNKYAENNHHTHNFCNLYITSIRTLLSMNENDIFRKRLPQVPVAVYHVQMYHVLI